MFLLIFARWILWIHFDSWNFCFQGFFIFSVVHFDICTRFPNWFEVTTNWCSISIQSFCWNLRAQCSAIPFSRQSYIPCKTIIGIVHIVDFCRRHFSVQLEIENVVFELDKNEFVLSMPIHQFLKMISWSLTYFVVYKNHVSTLVSEIHILSSCNRFLQHCTKPNSIEFSILKSNQSVFVVSLALPSSTIRNPFAAGSAMEPSISCSFRTSYQWRCSLQILCPRSCSPIQTSSEFWH